MLHASVNQNDVSKQNTYFYKLGGYLKHYKNTPKEPVSHWKLWKCI